MKPKRALNIKIPDIKRIRQFTMLLGRIGIESCVRHYPDPYSSFHKATRPTYGMGLKESKDYMEAKYDYDSKIEVPRNMKTHWADTKNPNRIVMIKAARILFKTMAVLSIPAPDWGLKECKDYVLRLYPLRQDESR